MAEQQHNDWPTKAELMDWVERAWAALEAVIDASTPEQLTRPDGADGWSIKDHLAHLTAWERSLLALLAGRERATALGMDRTTYERLDFDGKNAIIQRATRDLPLATVLAAFRSTHAEVVAALAPLTEADLQRSYSSFQPHDPPQNDRPIIGWIVGNTAGHYEEHLTAIRALAR